MTIAITGNRIVDAAARQGAAAARRETARQKSAAKKSSGKSGRKSSGGKFRGAGKAGRAASKRGGKGMSAKYIGKGSNAQGAVKYGMKKGATLIDSNCGFDIPTMAAGLSQKMRPEIKEQIVHLSFSTPPVSGRASNNEWRARLSEIRDKLGVDDSFAHASFQHSDADHDHIHLFFNRVNDEGALWKDNQVGLRLASLEQHLEQKFCLKLVNRADFKTTGNLPKTAVEQAMRKGVQPSFLHVQSAIREALQGKPDVLTYISRLADRGISVRPMLKMRELVGFGYKHDGQSYAGKQLGANWATLKTEVSYVPNEHFETLANLKQLVDAGKTRPTIAVIQAKPAPERDAIGIPNAKPATQRNVEKIPGVGNPLEPSAGQAKKTANQAAEPARQVAQPDVAAATPAKPAEVTPKATHKADPLDFLDADISGISGSDEKVAEVGRTVPINRDVSRLMAHDPITDQIRSKMFPTQTEALRQLALIKGERQAMAKALITSIQRHDYAKEAISREFITLMQGSPDAVQMLNQHVPGVRAEFIQQIIAPFEKARQDKADALYKYNRLHAETPTNQKNNSTPTM